MKIQNAEMEFVAFDAQDVIATSTTGGGTRTFTLSGLYDDKSYNISFIDSNGSFNYFESDGFDILDAFRIGQIGNLTLPNGDETEFWSLEKAYSVKHYEIFGNDVQDNEVAASTWNGIYKWVEAGGYFLRI